MALLGVKFFIPLELGGPAAGISPTSEQSFLLHGACFVIATNRRDIILGRMVISKLERRSMTLRAFAGRLALVGTISLLAVFALAQAPSVPAPPPTPRHPVTDTYQGVKVIDDYRWLEDWNDPVVKRWSAAENARTREYLDHLPARAAIKQRLQQLITASAGQYFDVRERGGVLFAMKFQPPKQQAFLVVLPSPDQPTAEKTVIDPNAMGKGGSVALDFYVPSLDGKLVAVSLSEGGSEDGTAHVFEVATGKELTDTIPRVNFATAGGSIDWNQDGSGFYYTRYPQGNERPADDANFYQQVYFHQLGTNSSQDTYVIGKDFPRIAEIQLHASDDGLWLLATVANGDGGEFADYLMNSSGKWTQVTHFGDAIVSAKLGTNGDAALYLLSRKDAPRGKVLRLPLADPTLAKAQLMVPQSSATGPDDSSRASIDGITPSATRLYVHNMVGGPSRVRIFDHQGHETGTLPTPAVSGVSEIAHTTGDNVVYEVSTYLEPAAWYSYDSSDGKSERTAMSATSPIKFDDAEVVREFAVSKDGTRVPVNIIRRKNAKLNGKNPTLLEGYGGYNISMTPGFLGSFGRMWLDQGGVYAIANLRGGGEYGEEWHKTGNLTHKQNVFDDFIACAEHLIQRNYTSPPHLAIMGGSNGGLLMGAVLTQRPDLFRAVVSFVGIYDMLRVELDPNGTFNTTEFGTVKDGEQFKALFAYSPYHHVQDGASYPAVLFLTGENDHRVNPMNSRKMTARLQAANGSSHPILLRTSSNAGHGIGTALDEEIEQGADVFCFLFDQLGITYVPPPAK
jgi:prolyl oligopeptidase